MKRKTALMLTTAAAVAIVLLGPLLLRPLIGKASNSQQAELSKTVKEIFDTRARAIVKESTEEAVLSSYDTTEKLGQWAHSHEKAKMDFVRLWMKSEGTLYRNQVRDQHTLVRTKGNHAELVVHQTLQVGYIYPGSTTVNRFGIGTRHWMKMKRKRENGSSARIFILTV